MIGLLRCMGFGSFGTFRVNAAGQTSEMKKPSKLAKIKYAIRVSSGKSYTTF